MRNHNKKELPANAIGVFRAGRRSHSCTDSHTGHDCKGENIEPLSPSKPGREPKRNWRAKGKEKYKCIEMTCKIIELDFRGYPFACRRTVSMPSKGCVRDKGPKFSRRGKSGRSRIRVSYHYFASSRINLPCFSTILSAQNRDVIGRKEKRSGHAPHGIR